MSGKGYLAQSIYSKRKRLVDAGKANFWTPKLTLEQALVKAGL